MERNEERIRVPLKKEEKGLCEYWVERKNGREQQRVSRGGNTTSQGDDGFDEPLYWKYLALQDLEWEGTLICLPPKLTSLSNNFAHKVIPLSMFPPSKTTTTLVPPMLPSVEDTTYVQPNLQDQLSALQNINSGNNTLDYRQTQFLNRAPNQVAPMWSGS